jgi:hypothetical protein
MVSNGITLIPKFIKTVQVIQTLKGGENTTDTKDKRTQPSELVRLFYSLKERK